MSAQFTSGNAPGATREPPALAAILTARAEDHPDAVYLQRAAGSVTYRDAWVRTTAIAGRLATIAPHADAPDAPVIAVAAASGESLLWLLWGAFTAGISLAFLTNTPDDADVVRLARSLGAIAIVTDRPTLTAHAHARAITPLTAPGPGQVAPPSRHGHLIFQTSGTTGAPKWVGVGYAQLALAVDCMATTGRLAHARQASVFVAPPLHYSLGVSTMLEYTRMGGSLILPDAGSPFGPVGSLRDGRLARSVTAIEGTPFFYTQLARWLPRLALDNLRHIGFGAGGPERAVLEQLLTRHPGVTVSTRYGLTESASTVTQKRFSPPHDLNEPQWRSSGPFLPLYDVRLIDEHGALVTQPDTPGELCLRGPALAWPYLGEPAAPDRFFHTGDVGLIDAAGELHILGRQSLFIKHKDVRFAPEAVESVVNALDGVAASRLSKRDGQLLLELVLSGPAIDLDRLNDALRRRLVDAMWPDRIITVDALPRTPSGKIKRTPGTAPLNPQGDSL